jgi:hypothetical protein
MFCLKFEELYNILVMKKPSFDGVRAPLNPKP